MRILPCLRIRTSRAHANAVERRGKNEVAVATLFLGHERGEGLIDGLGEVTRELARLPDDSEDLAALIIQRGELPRMNAVERRGFVGWVGGPRLPDLLGGKAREGRSLGNRNMPSQGTRGGTAPKLLAFLHNLIEVSLGINASTSPRLGCLVGDPGLRTFEPLMGFAAATRNSLLRPLFP